MKRQAVRILLKALPMIALVAGPLVAQSTTQPSSSPGAVIKQERIGRLLSIVQDYWQYETEGGRLTDEGWRAADVFFAHPVPPPRERTIYIIGYYGVGGGDVPVIKYMENPSPDRRAISRVQVSTSNAIGKLDSALRFFPSTTLGFDRIHNMVLTNKDPAWKFRDEDSLVFIGVPTAILYVRLMRDKATDPVVRKNARATLAVLEKIQPH